MAKEFDIYLRRRVIECDLMVLSLPFRDGITATNRLILESCIKAYELHKFVAIQTGSELVSHIDEMLKTCYEMLGLDTKLDICAEFQTHYSVYPEKSIIEISQSDINALTTMFTDAKSAMLIGASPLMASIGKPLGFGSSAMTVDAQMIDALKQSVLRLNTEVKFGANVSGTNELGFISIGAPIVSNADIVNLCYRITDTANTALEIAALVLGTEIHFSFGRAFSNISLSSSVKGTKTQKFETAANALNILSELTESITQFMEPEGTTIELTAEASSIVKRHRLLIEMDADGLIAYDDMTLEDTDFVIL